MSKIFRHYSDVIMGAMAAQITSLTIVHSTVYSGAGQRKPQSSASLAFMWGIHLWPVNSPHKWPVTRKMFPFDDVIMACSLQPHRPLGCMTTNTFCLPDCLVSTESCQSFSKSIYRGFLRRVRLANSDSFKNADFCEKYSTAAPYYYAN